MEKGFQGTLHKIPVDEIKKGMYLGDVFDIKGHLLFSAGTVINDPEQIELLKKHRIDSVYVSGVPERRTIEQNDAAEINADVSNREAAYYQELSRAKEVHQYTLQTAREALINARLGKLVPVKRVEATAEQIIDSVLRNTDALVSLAQIKGYDEYTYVHSVNVGVLITALAYSMGYTKDKLVHAGVGGLLHDIGKMGIPESILNKKGKYTSGEYAIMKRHPEIGINMLKGYKNISEISRTVVIQHHERYNGNGYPRHLSGSSISEIGLIAAVADVYDAMTTDRVYRVAWTPHKALSMIFQGCDTDYSRRIVELFTKNLGIYPVGSFVKLSSGEMGIVVRVEKGEILAPDVLILYSVDGKKLEKPKEYRLMKMQKQEDGKQYRIVQSLNPMEFEVSIEDYVKAKPFE
ncbi:MAG TPA: HD-GYP domain-containing protein [Chitinispirillaceae bacterium]|nr:HD-GYP domain-containing protein [Chitinispirillaceae bacterium]